MGYVLHLFAWRAKVDLCRWIVLGPRVVGSRGWLYQSILQHDADQSRLLRSEICNLIASGRASDPDSWLQLEVAAVIVNLLETVLCNVRSSQYLQFSSSKISLRHSLPPKGTSTCPYQRQLQDFPRWI